MVCCCDFRGVSSGPCHTMNPEKCLIYRRFPGFSAPRRRRRRVAYLGILGAKKERRPLPTPPLVFISRLLIMFGLSRFKTAHFPLKIQGFPHLPVQSRLIPRFSITLSLYTLPATMSSQALYRLRRLFMLSIKKSSRAHAAALPFRVRPAVLGSAARKRASDIFFARTCRKPLQLIGYGVFPFEC